MTNEAELLNNTSALLTFAEALDSLVRGGIIEREHAKALAKAYLKKSGFDVPKPIKLEGPKKEEAK